jgi:hypothetical protein
MRLTFATALLASLGAMTATAVPSTAAADEAGKGADWGRILVDLDTVARKGADVLDSPRCTAAGCQTDTNVTAAAPERDLKLKVQDTSNDVLTLAPTFSLVARDWGTSFRVAGDRLSVVDVQRLTSSTRMVLGRVRMNDARISPFAQVGLGQWRTDPYLLPLTPRYTEIAAQAAGGVEVRVSTFWQLAFETATTVLYRENQSSTGIPAPHTWSTMFASRIDF